jgi:RHS repeat-associated protein
VTTFTYHPTSGQVSGIASPGGVSLSYTYDGSLLTGTTWTGPVAGSVTRTYDTDFRVATESVNGGNSITFQYDPDSLLTSAGALTLTRNAEHGLLTGTTLGNVTDTYTYSPFGELATYQANYSASPLLGVTYTRDPLGRITQKVETIGGVTTTTVYGYDTAGRLTDVTTDGTLTAHYEFDPNGNRLSVTRPGTGTVAGTYDAQDRLVTYGAVSYTYNANGDLLSSTSGGQTTTYTYDVFGNLVSVGLPNGNQIEYVIDGQNRRIGKKVNGTLVQGLLYSGQLRPVAELDGSGGVVVRFVYGTKINVPEYMVKGGVTYRLITDHLGSVRLVLNTADGTIAQRLDYDEFGQIVLDTAPGFQPFGFAGGLYDPDIKLVRFGARDYDAFTGRWTTKDPIRLRGRDTNFYGYARQNPLKWVDPRGLYWEYSQSTGQLWHFPPEGGAGEFAGEGYSGSGEGLNNPLYQLEPNVGPIPEGEYRIGPPVPSPLGNPTMSLTPKEGTETFGRGPFLIHADNPCECFTASKGCVVLPREVRQRIAGSGDPNFRVVP